MVAEAAATVAAAHDEARSKKQELDDWIAATDYQELCLTLAQPPHNAEPADCAGARGAMGREDNMRYFESVLDGARATHGQAALACKVDAHREMLAALDPEYTPPAVG